MKLRTTLILFSLALAVGLFIKYYESKRPNTEESTRRAQNIVNFERDKIDSIAIQNGEQHLELKRTDQKWRVEVPVKDLADNSVIDNLLFELEDWQKAGTITNKEIEADKSKLADYGLSKPKLRLRLGGKEAPPEILFGNDAALENKVYVRLDNSKDVFLAAKGIRDQVAKKPEDFRDRKLTDVVPAQVNRLTIKSAAGELELQKRADHWKLNKPLRARADDQKVSDLIAQVTNSHIQQFIAGDGGDLQSYGLAEPRGTITLYTGDDQSGQPLQIGAPVEKEQVYVRFIPRHFVYTLPKKVEEILLFKPNDLRDRKLVRFDQNQLDRITIEARGKSKVTLARKGENWTIVEKKDAPANGDEVRRLLTRLENENVGGFAEDVASDLARYGLNEPQLILTLSSFASENTAETNAGEHPLATIAFGRFEGNMVYARIGDDPYVVSIPRQFLDEVSADPRAWQPLAIFNFTPEQIHRVAFNNGLVLSRVNEKDWKSSTENAPINAANLQSFLKTLAHLRAVRWMSTDSFKQPAFTIDFTTSVDDKTVHQLALSDPAGNEPVLARTSERDGVFAISPSDFNALRLPLTGEAPVPTPTPTSP